MKAKQVPKRVRDDLWNRSGGLCEKCGVDPAEVAHHRRPRGMGGSRDAVTNTLANLLHVSNLCHLQIESNRADSLEKGWLVLQGQDPRVIPVCYRDYDRPQILNVDGTFCDATGTDAKDAKLIADLFGMGYAGEVS